MKRIGGCATRNNILGILFGEFEKEEIIPIRLRTSCKNMLKKVCNIESCNRYRIGTLGSYKISWDRKGLRI